MNYDCKMSPSFAWLIAHGIINKRLLVFHLRRRVVKEKHLVFQLVELN